MADVRKDFKNALTAIIKQLNITPFTLENGVRCASRLGKVKRIICRNHPRSLFCRVPTISPIQGVKLKPGKFQPQNQLKPIWTGTIFP